VHIVRGEQNQWEGVEKGGRASYPCTEFVGDREQREEDAGMEARLTCEPPTYTLRRRCRATRGAHPTAALRVTTKQDSGVRGRQERVRHLRGDTYHTHTRTHTAQICPTGAWASKHGGTCVHVHGCKRAAWD
jgi:hypothetical protein